MLRSTLHSSGAAPRSPEVVSRMVWAEAGGGGACEGPRSTTFQNLTTAVCRVAHTVCVHLSLADSHDDGGTRWGDVCAERGGGPRDEHRATATEATSSGDTASTSCGVGYVAAPLPLLGCTAKTAYRLLPPGQEPEAAKGGGGERKGVGEDALAIRVALFPSAVLHPLPPPLPPPPPTTTTTTTRARTLSTSVDRRFLCLADGRHGGRPCWRCEAAPFLRHERPSVAMALAEAQHHSAPKSAEARDVRSPTGDRTLPSQGRGRSLLRRCPSRREGQSRSVAWLLLGPLPRGLEVTASTAPPSGT